ncbi:MAG: 3-dehydroquinate synthase II [Bilophila sp.]
MVQVFFKSVPFFKEDVTLALESGVDGIITDAAQVQGVRALARCVVRAESEMPSGVLDTKAAEERIAARIVAGETLVLARGFEVIPVENLLAQLSSRTPTVFAGASADVSAGAEGEAGSESRNKAGELAVEVASVAEARLAAGILECGVPVLVVVSEGLPALKEIVAELKVLQGKMELVPATITEVRTVGLGHRVCVDTLSLFERGQGMLVGNSSAFTFLVHAETEHNEYVASRPFRINAGGVHAYAVQPRDKTCYISELQSGDAVLIVRQDGSATLATVGRIKTEVRPMVLITAEADTPDGMRTGSIFLQNAETIRLVRSDGVPVSVVALKPGDAILCHMDQAGRHFGMRVQENIREI